MFSTNAIYRSGQQRLQELHTRAEQEASIRRARRQYDETPMHAENASMPHFSRVFKPLRQALR